MAIILTSKRHSVSEIESEVTNDIIAAVREVLDPQITTLSGAVSGLSTDLSDLSSAVDLSIAAINARAYRSLLGPGSDGAVHLTGSNDVGFANRVGSVYTVTRDIWCTDLTIDAGVTLALASTTNGNFRIRCTGTVTNAGIITTSGKNASGNTSNVGLAGGSLPGAGLGGAGGTGAGVAGGNGVIGGTAGAGGAGGTPTPGGAGAAGTTTYTMTQAILTQMFSVPTGLNVGTTWWGANNRNLTGGCGGGGGGGDATNPGGAGGAGGAIMGIFAKALVNTGTLRANGGNGATMAAGNVGGGGGGGAGPIVVVTFEVATMGTVETTGGAKGLKYGNGSDGAIGGDSFNTNIVLG